MENRLYRSVKDRILGGVCGGLANYLQIDVVLVRLFFLVFTLVGGVGPLVYIIMWILVPSEEGVYPGAQPYTINGEEIKEKAESNAPGLELTSKIMSAYSTKPCPRSRGLNVIFLTSFHGESTLTPYSSQGCSKSAAIAARRIPEYDR